MTRKKGMNVLSQLLDGDNIKKIEQIIWEKSDKDNKIYNKLLYEITGDIISNVKVDEIYSMIENNLLDWNHPKFKEYKIEMEEENLFIENPIEVEEGVLQCVCGSNKVFSFSRQTRGADEPMTTFAECVECKNKWQYSG